MQPLSQRTFNRRVPAENIWLERPGAGDITANLDVPYEYRVLDTEEQVGAAMLNELLEYSQTTYRDIVMILLGGRGAQAMYRLIRDRAESGDLDELLGRLHVFTQDALAPMRMDNGLSFVRDFERLLGHAFF